VIDRRSSHSSNSYCALSSRELHHCSCVNRTRSLRSSAASVESILAYKLKLHLFDLFWICCGLVVQQVVWLVAKLWICCTAFRLVADKSKLESHTPLIRFVADLLLSPQKIHNILTMSRCCGFAEQLVIQQIEQVQFELQWSPRSDLLNHRATGHSWLPRQSNSSWKYNTDKCLLLVRQTERRYFYDYCGRDLMPKITQYYFVWKLLWRFCRLAHFLLIRSWQDSPAGWVRKAWIRFYMRF
jgi:hypothetical protein